MCDCAMPVGIAHGGTVECTTALCQLVLHMAVLLSVRLCMPIGITHGGIAECATVHANWYYTWLYC